MERPGYYSILTADIRYDPRLKRHADCKVLYSEITALANKAGYCHASNKYFAELYGRPKETISRWINLLISLGYLKVKKIYEKNTRAIKERRLYPVSTPVASTQSEPIDADANTPIDVDDKGGIDAGVKGPIDADVKENNTRDNITSINNIYSRRSQTNDSTPNQKQNDTVKQVIDYLNKKTGRVKSRDQFSYRTKQYRSLINARLKDGYTLSDFKKVIDNKCHEWLHDPDMTRFLRPSTLFRPINFDQYLKEKPVKPRIRSQGKKIVEQGTDWSKKKAKVSGDLMSDAQMDAIFNSFGNSSLGGQQ